MSLQKFNAVKRYLKIFALSVFFLIKCNFLFAQKDISDSAKTLEYWSKRGIIEVVYAYMKDYIATVTDPSLSKEKMKDCTKEITGLNEYEKKFIAPLDSWKDDELTKNISELSAFLKNSNWEGAEKNILQPLFINLNEKETLNKAFFSTLKPTVNESSTVIRGYINKMSNWNETVDRIIAEYNGDLKKLKTNTDSGKVSKITSNIQVNPRVEKPIKHQVKSLEIDWVIFILSCLLSFLVGITLVYFYVKSRVYSVLNRDLEKYETTISHSGLFSFLSIVKLLKKRKDLYQNRVDELEKEIENLKKKLHPENTYPYKTSGDPVDTKISSTKKELQDRPVDVGLSKEGGNRSELFFSISENDGSFMISKGEQANDGSMYYRIEFRNNSDEGDLHYISGSQDKRAINRLDSYLKPVCDIDNIINADNAVKIELLNPGKVIKRSDSWVVDPSHKVKIKLV